MASTILLIDDSEIWGKYMVESLSDEGFQVAWAKSKREAEGFLKKQPFVQPVVASVPVTTQHEGEIFVSYAWGGESERTVDELEQMFAKRGLHIVRDKKDLAYKGSIKEFEQRIGQGQCVILVISDKYLRSEHCMYELVEIDENHEFQKRIFPIVLEDARIYEVIERLNYIQHWNERIEKLNQAIKQVPVMINLASITADLDKYARIRAKFDRLTNLLGDMNALTPEIHKSSGFFTLIDAVEFARNEKRPQQQPHEMATPASKIHDQLEKNIEIEAVITNLNLVESAPVLDGRGYLILEYLQEYHPQLPKIAISALSNEGEKVGDLYHRYKVDYVAIKSDKELVPKLVHELRQLVSPKMRPLTWDEIVVLILSVVAPYVVVPGLPVGTKTREVISVELGKMWEWIRKSIQTHGNQQDKQLLNDFQHAPAQHQDKLRRTLLVLIPEEDIALRKLAQNLIQELFKLLEDPDDFRMEDLERICSQVDEHWKADVAHPTGEALARWLVTYVRTRQKEQQLVDAIIKITPMVFSR